MNEEWSTWTGRSEIACDVITPSLLARYAATMDSDPASIPLALHWCLCTPDCGTSELGADGHPPKGGFLPPVSLARRMWAGSDIGFSSPFDIGEPIERRSTILSIDCKTGSSGPLVFVKVEHLLSCNSRECISDLQTIVYRAASDVPAAMPEAAGYRPEGQMALKTVRPNETLLFRYSALTFNTHRIHYDATYAVNEEGYPALVVQGPLVASMMLDLAAETFGADQIARFSYRANSPAFAGQDIHLTIAAPENDLCLCQVYGDDGRLVMSGKLSLR